MAATSQTHRGVILLLLLLVALTATEGASLFKSGEHKNKTEHEHMVPLQLDPRLLTPQTAHNPLNNISISPWDWEVSHDASVFPSVSEARCRLKGCLDAYGHENRSLESRPIYHQVVQLRRVRSAPGQPYHYRLEQRLLVVGCTCVQPVVQQQQ